MEEKIFGWQQNWGLRREENATREKVKELKIVRKSS